MNSPLFQASVKDFIVSSHHKHNVKPSFWEEFTAMVVNQVTTLPHLVLQVIQYLKLSDYI